MKSSICFYFRLVVDPQVDRGDELKRAGGVGALQQEDPEVLGCPECGGGSPQVSRHLSDGATFLSVNWSLNHLKIGSQCGPYFKVARSLQCLETAQPNLEHFNILQKKGALPSSITSG